MEEKGGAGGVKGGDAGDARMMGGGQTDLRGGRGSRYAGVHVATGWAEIGADRCGSGHLIPPVGPHEHLGGGKQLHRVAQSGAYPDFTKVGERLLIHRHVLDL